MEPPDRARVAGCREALLANVAQRPQTLELLLGPLDARQGTTLVREVTVTGVAAMFVLGASPYRLAGEVAVKGVGRRNDYLVMRPMTLRLWTATITAATIVLAAPSLGADDRRTAGGSEDEDRRPETFRVSVYGRGRLSRLRVLVQVPRHEENRTLRVTLDSGGFYRSSDVQLDGEVAPLHHYIDWPQVPRGQYCLDVTVLGTSSSRERQRRPVLVGVAGVMDNPCSDLQGSAEPGRRIPAPLDSAEDVRRRHPRMSAHPRGIGLE